MKFFKRHIYSGLMLLLLTASAACSDSSSEEPVDSKGKVKASFSFRLDPEETVSRGVNGYDGAETDIIGTGSMIDHLIFAVYDNSDNLLFTNVTEDVAKTIDGKVITPSAGQFVISWPAVKQIELTALEEGEYRMVCWAQSSACNAYNTADFKNVTVSYSGALNNDESRDAFYASVPFTVSANSLSTTVVLTRPFAQINVGTTGADYRNTAITPGGTYYTYSSVEIKGVATSIDLVKNQISKTTGNATFGFSKIPAYFSMEIPKDNQSLLQSAGELFLKIHLNDTKNTNNPFASYLTSYPTVKNDDKGNITEYLTETFKYLSMCYVLVPGKSTLDNFRITFANDAAGTGYATYIEIPNVPVNVNWRTNIIGGLYAPPAGNPSGPSDPGNPGDPKDPDGPIDDPSSLFNDVSASVLIITNYDNNGNYQKDKNNGNGHSEID